MTATPGAPNLLTKESLKALRVMACLNQTQMADALMCSLQVYNQYETGRRNIPRELSLCIKSRVIKYLTQQQAAIGVCIDKICKAVY